MNVIKKIKKKYKKIVQAIIYTPKKHHHIFVVGVQRSGTNMMMKIFDNSVECTVFHDSDPLANKNYIQRSSKTLRALSDNAKSNFIVFKPMTELHRINQFMKELPPAVGIWLYRDVEDVVNSQIKLWSDMPEFMKEFSKNRHTNNWRAGGISDKYYAIVQKYVSKGLNNATAVALIWLYKNVQFFEMGHDVNPNINIINYNDCVKSPEEDIKPLFERIGIKYESHLIKHIHSDFIQKNDPPDIDKEVLLLCKELDNKFRKHFQKLKK